METIKKETVKTTEEKDRVGGFILNFGGDHRNDSIQIKDLPNPEIIVSYKGREKKVSLKELASLMGL